MIPEQGYVVDKTLIFGPALRGLEHFVDLIKNKKCVLTI